MYMKELPPCSARFGRTDHISCRLYLACGYEEVCPEDCVMCGGFDKQNSN